MISSKYKDRLFSFIFGRAERKDWTLSLYNAVNHSSYTNPDDITVMTMEDVLYMGMKNDLSFFVTNIINMYEQQSSYNPNMPIRKLMYASRLYDRYIHINRLNIYGTKLIPLPVPKLVTFYNGKEDKEDEILELKNAFRDKKGKLIDAEADIEVRVRMININYGRNKELMSACKPLLEYAWLIDMIRNNVKTMGIEDAVDKALDSMPDDFDIKMLLIANKAEVKQMCLTEYNETETMEMFREEGREEGLQEGLQAMIEGLQELGASREKTSEKVREKTTLSDQQVETIMSRYWK